MLSPFEAEAAPSPIILQDRTVRSSGPVMFIGDSVSAKFSERLPGAAAKAGLGPFRFDIQVGRSVSRNGFGWGRNAVRSIRYARSRDFAPSAVVVALGWVDILAWSNNPQPIRTPKATVGLIEPLLDEIGPDVSVTFLDLMGTRYKRRLAPAFNDGLAMLKEQRPNLNIAAWSKYAAGHGSWFQGDGYHMTRAGGLKRQTFIINALVAAAASPPIGPGPTTTLP